MKSDSLPMILNSIITTVQFQLETKSLMLDCILTTLAMKMGYHKKSIKKLIIQKKEAKLKALLKSIIHKIESNQLKIIQNRIWSFGFFLIRENKVPTSEDQIKDTLLIILYLNMLVIAIKRWKSSLMHQKFKGLSFCFLKLKVNLQKEKNKAVVKWKIKET